MDWKRRARELCGDALESSIAVADVHTETLAKAVRLMLYHWPEEPEQRDDAKGMAFMANTIQAAHKALGTAVGDDLVMACERFRKEFDKLKDDYQALSRGYDLLREATERAKEALGANGYENVDHAAERVAKDRDELQAALAEQMAENGRLAAENKLLSELPDVGAIPPVRPRKKVTGRFVIDTQK